jgi:hypothetical protein
MLRVLRNGTPSPVARQWNIDGIFQQLSLKSTINNWRRWRSAG